MTNKIKIIAAIIAGGQSSRMGGEEKCMLALKEKRIIERIIEKLSPQTDKIIINANGSKARFIFTGLEIIPDTINKGEGPLIGIYSAMKYIYENFENRENTMLMCVPSDSPFIPNNLASKLYKGYKDNNANAACIKLDGKINPIFNLLPIYLLDDLEYIVKNTNIRAVYKWLQSQRLAEIEFKDQTDFFNINTKDELKIAEKLAETKQ